MLIRLKGTPIAFQQITDEAFLKALLQFCRAKKEEFNAAITDWKNQGLPASEAHYSSYNLFAMPGLPQILLEHLREWAPDFIKELALNNNPIWIMGWANYLKPGSVFQMHDHGQCSFFGHLLLEDQGTRNLYLSDGTLEIYTKPGMVTLVGDGKMMHGTTPVITESERISIGFDFFCGEKPLNPRSVKF